MSKNPVKSAPVATPATDLVIVTAPAVEVLGARLRGTVRGERLAFNLERAEKAAARKAEKTVNARFEAIETLLAKGDTAGATKLINELEASRPQ